MGQGGRHEPDGQQPVLPQLTGPTGELCTYGRVVHKYARPVAQPVDPAQAGSMSDSWNPLRIALDLVLPRPCPGCGGPDPWCAGCASVLDNRPRLIELPEATLDAAAGMSLPPARALARYAGPVRAAILAGKE